VSNSVFWVIDIPDWKSAVRLIARLRYYIFRGQAHSDWKLETALERQANRLNAWADLVVAEWAMLQEFKRRAHHHLKVLPHEDDTISWLALIQHYGGPTRLLDFTRSPYVAAFFAMEQAQDDAAIWALDLDELGDRNLAKFGPPQVLNPGLEKKHLIRVNAALAEKAGEPGVLHTEPFVLDERISKQQGCFLVPLSLSCSFEENLEATFGTGSLRPENAHRFTYRESDPYTLVDPAPILKIILPRRHHPDAMLDLDAMNVNSASLFGGLDGFARSLPSILRKYERRHYESAERRELFERRPQPPRE
jgi:hypothetical protein